MDIPQIRKVGGVQLQGFAAKCRLGWRSQFCVASIGDSHYPDVEGSGYIYAAPLRISGQRSAGKPAESLIDVYLNL